MRKLISGIFLISMLIFTALPIYGATVQIKVDDVAISSDIAPQMRNNRTMVPLRVISENLGANVDWSNDKVTLTKGGMRVILQIGSAPVIKNGEIELLDVKPYVKNKRIMIPLRFIAETFGCQVSYEASAVTISTEPLVINGIRVETTQHEYRMTMGGVVREIKGNMYNKAIYDVFLENKRIKTEAPISYAWMPDLDTIGAYYKFGQYNFKNISGEDIQQFNVYLLINAHPAEDLMDYPKALLHDVAADQWYLFSEYAIESLQQLMDAARKNGFLHEISNNVV